MKTSKVVVNCSYPTYEEWKPGELMAVIWVLRVLILPMRNGNMQIQKPT